MLIRDKLIMIQLAFMAALCLVLLGYVHAFRAPRLSRFTSTQTSASRAASSSSGMFFLVFICANIYYLQLCVSTTTPIAPKETKEPLPVVLCFFIVFHLFYCTNIYLQLMFLLSSFPSTLALTLLPELTISPFASMFSLFTEQPDHSQIFSVPFDSTPSVFDSKISFYL
jgi:hypothetical protein